MATERGTRGFWRGFLTGTIIAAAVGLGLAWAVPPVPILPPEVAPETLVPRSDTDMAAIASVAAMEPMFEPGQNAI